MSAPAPSPVGAGADAGRLGRLRDERDFLLSSIEDLESEHAAGDISEEDYARLRASYVGRAAAALREIAALEEAARLPLAAAAGPGAPPGALPGWTRLRRFLGRRRTRRALGVVGLVCVLGIVGIAAAHFAGARLPGQSETGSISLPSATTIESELAHAAKLDAEGNLTAAIAAYDSILRSHPRQPEALTYRGWLLRLTGIAGHDKALVLAGDLELATAVRVAPANAAARALDGVAMFEDQGRIAAALSMFRAALADHPAPALLKVAGPTMAAAFVQAHVALPERLSAYAPH